MSEDLRIIKTKKALKEALFELLKKQHFDELSVNSICERAGVRRATFYKHFKDKYDFLTYIISSLRDEFDETFFSQEQPESAVEYYVEYLASFIDFLDENREVMTSILASDMRMSLVVLIMKQNYADTLKRLERSVQRGMVLPSEPGYVASLLAGGFGSILLVWLNEGMKTPKEKVFAETSALLRKIIG